MNDVTAAAHTNFSSTFGLTQEQLDVMDGDSGTILPAGLERPAQWPEVDLHGSPDPDAPTNPDPTTALDNPFVFLACAYHDRQRVDVIRNNLIDEGLQISGKQDTDSGVTWPSEYWKTAEAAACVLTLWAEASGSSDGVRELASSAMSRETLVHAHLDPVFVPFFCKDRSIDLTDWDGTATHPAMQQLIQSIRGKVERPAELVNPEESDLRPEPGTTATTEDPVNGPSFRTSTIKTHIARNRSALVLNNASLLAQIAGFRVKIRKNNHLSVGHPEVYDGLLSFLDQLAEDIENLTASVPDGDEEFTDEDAEGTAGYFARFIARAKPGFAKYFTAENLGDAAPPASIILGCGALGYLVTGLNPLGFGAGTLAGKFLTNEIKSGAVADMVEKLVAEHDTPSDL